DKVQFQVDLVPIAPTSTGADQTIFAFSPNPGEPLQPLAETASGGEMSRFLLALKTCFSQIDPVATFAFDEVDVGVSGRVAQAIAETLYRLGQAHQILCVTHQPIVAAMADHHFHVEKILIPGSKPEGNHGTLEPEARTVVRIQLLEDRQRALELAHLAGGGETDQMLAFATSLLQQADQIRQQASTRSREAEKAPASRGKRAAQRKVSPKAS
ncbi:MAG TPA: DNA repair protein RecN, partial [Stenomitos sp.]